MKLFLKNYPKNQHSGLTNVIYYTKKMTGKRFLKLVAATEIILLNVGLDMVSKVFKYKECFSECE